MFTILFAALGELLVWGMVAYVLYRLVFWKSIKERKILKQNKENAEKLAILMLKSSSVKEISSFLKDNTSFLSEKTFTVLVEHLDYISVLNDEPLKARFEDLETKTSNSDEELIIEESTTENQANFKA
jgi:hypothetical protein